MATKDKTGKKKGLTSVSNKKAYHEYHVLEVLKAGIVLTGTEIKSIRNGKVSINDGFVRIEKGEALLYGMHISPYEQGTHYNHDPDRLRKLLLTRREINKLLGRTKEEGLTLVPLRLYFERCWVKVDVGLCKGKKIYDKRQAIAERSTKREIERSMKHNAR